MDKSTKFDSYFVFTSQYLIHPKIKSTWVYSSRILWYKCNGSMPRVILMAQYSHACKTYFCCS